jgi:hypothetical protein
MNVEEGGKRDGQEYEKALLFSETVAYNFVLQV